MSRKTFVYFVAPKIGGPIKIGCSYHPVSRLENLMTWSPYALEILAHAPGTFEDERAIHGLFVEAWSHGEWFRPTVEMFALIAEVKATGEIPARARGVKGQVGIRRQLPRKPWTEEAKAKARKVHQDRWNSIRASRAARPEIVAFLQRTGMSPAELDSVCGSRWVAHQTVKSGDCQHGADRVPHILAYIRGYTSQAVAA